MKVCAVFEVDVELRQIASGGVISIPTEKLTGYAVFENGQMISPIFNSYKEAAQWMKQMLEGLKSPRQSRPRFGM